MIYDRANSSALQATAACGAHRQMIINDTSVKMTYVVVLSINALMTYVVADRCGL